MAMIVPPGGFAGFAQMTQASKRSLFKPGRAPARRASTGRRAPARVRRAPAPARARAGARKLKFGSPAWQKKYRVGAFAKRRK